MKAAEPFVNSQHSSVCIRVMAQHLWQQRGLCNTGVLAKEAATEGGTGRFYIEGCWGEYEKPILFLNQME